ncbi:MAG: hypothetical protein ABL984_00310 [Pyrinomonadaceae bacterium]
MPSLKTILKPMGIIEILFGSEPVKVTYRPQYLTPEFEEKLKTLNTEDKSTEAFLSLFCSVIVEWDLKLDDADEKPIPITVAALRSIPYDVLGEVLSKVQEAVVPPPPKGPNSGDSSLRVDGSAPSPIGTV